jgi:hypothetical protein
MAVIAALAAQLAAKDVILSGMDWIDLAQDRDQMEDSCEHGNEPSGSIEYWEVLE